MLDSEKRKKTTNNENSQEKDHNNHKERILSAWGEKAFQTFLRSVYNINNYTFFNSKIIIQFGPW